jgi:hypothetical protein
VSPFEIEADAGEILVGQHNDAAVAEAVVKTVGDPPKPKLLVVYEVSDGSQLADWLTPSKPSRWKWEELWAAAGLAFPVVDGKLTFNEADLIGKRVHIEVIDEEYNGQVRRKVKAVSKPVDADVPIDMPEAEATSEKGDADVPF